MKDKSLSVLIKEADELCSEYVRLKAKDNSGIIYCFICGKPVPWRLSQAMHFITRQSMSVRYHLMNVHAGCVDCNCFDSGHPSKYMDKMYEVYGSETVAHIIKISRGLSKFTRAEMKDIILSFKHKLKQIRN